MFEVAPRAAWIFATLALMRLGWTGWRWVQLRPGRRPASPWTAGAATLVIGLTFVGMLLLVGSNWAYTDVLAELSAGKFDGHRWRLLLLGALFAGALAGGYGAGNWRSSRLDRAQVCRCFGGGVMMGIGSLMIPGSNDGLILLGMPLLQPHAWLAFGAMCLTIAAAMRIKGLVGIAARR